jgi:C1A family cysteine protease
MAKKSRAIPPKNRICNLVPSKNTDRDWDYANAVRAGALTARAALPASVDLRAPWWTIGDQESTGSCVGWGSTDGVARYHMVKAGKLEKAKRLSPRCTWMASKETDEFNTRPDTFIESGGTSLKAAMDILRKFGSVPEELLPFHIATNMYLGEDNDFYASMSTRRIAAYYNLRKNLANWKAWLATKGPILIGLSVDSTWDNAAATGGELDVFRPSTARGGHAVCAVGYTSKGRIIIRNSWGTAWGDKGFAYASEDYIRDAFFDESYGVTL